LPRGTGITPTSTIESRFGAVLDAVVAGRCIPTDAIPTEIAQAISVDVACGTVATAIGAAAPTVEGLLLAILNAVVAGGWLALIVLADPRDTIGTLAAAGTDDAWVAVLTTVDVGFAPVLDSVVTGGRLACTIVADSRDTIVSEHAARIVCTRVTTPAAVDIGFVPILNAVTTSCCHTDSTLAVEFTEPALTVGPNKAALTGRALAAIGTPAIVTGFAAVLDAVVACWCLTDVVVTDLALAVVGVATRLSVRTGSTPSAAVHVALISVLDAIVTGRSSRAGAVVTETALTVAIGPAAGSIGTAITDRATTVDVRLVSVLEAIVTGGCGGAGAVVTQATQAVAIGAASCAIGTGVTCGAATVDVCLGVCGEQTIIACGRRRPQCRHCRWSIGRR